MAEAVNRKIPVTILTGFLGAGKTTLLNRILEHEKAVRIAVLVNDFGAINIDSRLIIDIQGDIVTLDNGCICCSIREAFVAVLYQLINQKPPPEHIIIETSGVADPAQIVLTFNRSVLRSQAQIDNIITVVDAGQLDILHYKQKRLAQDQIKLAGLVILNKVDLVDTAALQHIRAWLQSVTPHAIIKEAVFGNIMLEKLLESGAYNPQTAFDRSGPGVHVYPIEEENMHQHNDHSLVFNTWSWTCDEPLSGTAFVDVMKALPLPIFRVKGIVHVWDDPDKQMIFQMVGKHASLKLGTVWNSKAPQTEIIMIAEKGQIDEQSIALQLEQCRASATAYKTLLQLTDGVLEWARVSSTSL